MAFIVPAIAAVATAMGASAAVATAIGWAGALALSVGASLALKSVFGKKKASQTSSITGMTGDAKIGGDAPRRVIFGTAAVEGHLVYINSYGASNAHEEEVYVLSDWECDSLVGIIVDGEEKTLVPQTALYGEDARFFVNDRDNGNGDTTDDENNYGSKLEIRFYRGAASQTADAGLVAHANPPDRWTSAHRGDGVCYVVVDKTYDADLFSGFPTFKFVVKGAKLYDWRKDDTAGGSGAHRWDSPETWEHSANPAVCLYAYQRGFFRDGKILMGQGVPPADLVIDLFTAAANVSDEAVSLAAGGTEPRYEVSATAFDDAQHRDVIESFVNAMGGWLYERAGSYAPIAGAAQSVAVTITDDDLLLEGAVKVARKRSRADLVNYVSGKFTSTDDLWETKGFTPISSPANEAADGERLGKQIDLPHITSQARAERIALLRYNENRCQTRATIPLSLKHVAIEIGDWVRWNSARYGDRVYRVSDWGLSLIGGQIGLTLGLSEIASSVYGWNPMTDEGAPISRGTPRIDSAKTRSLTGFVVSPSTVAGSGGGETPAIVVEWAPPSDETVTAVLIEYRISGETDTSSARSDAPESGGLVIAPLPASTTYEMRATVSTDPPRATTWTTWASVTTPAMVLPPASVDAAALIPSLSAQIEDIATSVGEIRDHALRLTGQQDADRSRATRIGARVKSEVVEKYDAVTGALAVRIDTVEAATAAAEAAIATETTARADADTAIASQVTALEAATDAATAEGSVSFVAAADQTGALARFELRAKTGLAGSGVTASAAMVLEAVSSGGEDVSQVKFTADRFYVTDAAGAAVAPFAVVDGVVFVDLLQVRTDLLLGGGGYGGRIIVSDDT